MFLLVEASEGEPGREHVDAAAMAIAALTAINRMMMTVERDNTMPERFRLLDRERGRLRLVIYSELSEGVGRAHGYLLVGIQAGIGGLYHYFIACGSGEGDMGVVYK